ncbi:MAG TPA: glycosyltransferase, partial [Rhodothermales bacterium]|nr:glycosyltransferase [Rhodothermales bacterium]
AADPRIRVLQTPRNLGMAGNANFAVAQATRPFVALLHHDDIHRADMLERWADVMVRYPDVAYVFNAYDEVNSRGVTKLKESFPERMEGPAFLQGRLLRGWGCPVRGTAMIRRSCWDEAGGMREAFGLLADVDLWMRLAARWAVGFVDAPLIRVRHERPEDYPEDYVGLSWRRNRILYEIHAENLRASLPPSLRRGLRRLRQRAAISLDAVKWMGYAFVRRPALLTRADEGATRLEWLPVRGARALAARWARRRSAPPAPETE